jgi:hypothetical protein
MNRNTGIKAYRPSFINELSDADMQQRFEASGHTCTLFKQSQNMGRDFL